MFACSDWFLLPVLLLLSAIQAENAVEDKYNMAAKECYEIEKVSTDDMNKQQTKLDLETNPKFRAFTLCKFRKLGYMDEQGNVLTHVIKHDVLECSGDEKKAAKIMETLKSCMGKKATPEDTAVTLHGCISAQ